MRIAERYPKSCLAARTTVVGLLLGAIVELFDPFPLFLPTPSTVWDAAAELWRDYDLIYQIGASFTEVYLALFIGYAVALLLSPAVGAARERYRIWFGVFRIDRLLVFAALFGVVFAQWFPSSDWATFALLAIVGALAISSAGVEDVERLDRSYLDAAATLAPASENLAGKTLRSYLRLSLTKRIVEAHEPLWALALFVEFAKGEPYGAGYLIAEATRLWNPAYVFAAVFATLVAVLVGAIGARALKRMLYVEA